MIRVGHEPRQRRRPDASSARDVYWSPQQRGEIAQRAALGRIAHDGRTGRLADRRPSCPTRAVERPRRRGGPRPLDGARWAPTGGNRQGVRFIVVRDATKRRALRDLYVPLWDQYASRARTHPGAPLPRLMANADHMAQHLDEVPVLIVVCAQLADLLATDRHLDRLTIVGGASVYPAVQNLLLAARAEGLGTALTTLLCAVEGQVKTLLGIPDVIATAALIPMGYPAKGFPKRLARRPVEAITFGDAWDTPLFA